jgi:hypothetical protein
MKISEDTSLEEILRIHTEMWPSDARNKSLYEKVYRDGRNFTPAELPKGIRRKPQRYCFDNSVEVFNERGLAYVEGYAISSVITGMPIHHAWNVTEDGIVVDTTWVPAGLEYYGVVIEITGDEREAYVTPLGVIV